METQVLQRQQTALNPATDHMAAYRLGDRDRRPWGEYVVTGAGEDGGQEYCEKTITVLPLKIASLQSHALRSEHWEVESGTLTVLLDGERMELSAGDDIFLPVGSIHCFANLGDEPCVFRERQEGICREEDIVRHVDAYGRGTEDTPSEAARRSVASYADILADIRKREGLS
jgi:mannose-6-phosphate isomerase-like protein (cupin superfamily)